MTLESQHRPSNKDTGSPVEKIIDWKKPASEILELIEMSRNNFMAVAKYDNMSDQKIGLTDAIPVPGPTQSPGEISEAVDREDFIVEAGQGLVLVKRVFATLPTGTKTALDVNVFGFLSHGGKLPTGFK